MVQYQFIKLSKKNFDGSRTASFLWSCIRHSLRIFFLIKINTANMYVKKCICLSSLSSLSTNFLSFIVKFFLSCLVSMMESWGKNIYQFLIAACKNDTKTKICQYSLWLPWTYNQAAKCLLHRSSIIHKCKTKICNTIFIWFYWYLWYNGVKKNLS